MSNFIWKSWRQRLSSMHRSKPCRRFHRLELEQLENRVVPTLSVFSQYTGLASSLNGSNPGEPPDNQGAVGPNSVVETVNQLIGIYTPKGTGSNATTDTLGDFFFTQGGLSHVSATDEQSDSFVTYDPLAQRFIVGDLDFDTSNTNGDGNQLLLAVSKTSNPTTFTKSSWYFYPITTTESTVALQDYPGNIGYNADAFVVTLNSYDSGGNPLHSQVNVFSTSAFTSGAAPTLNTNYFQTDYSNDFLMRPATMPDATPGGPMWLVAEHGDNKSLDVIRMTNLLSASPNFTPFNLAVNPYSPPATPNDPGGPIDSGPDSRILQVGERNGILVAAHEVGDAAGDANLARWYEINIGSGTPALQQQGELGGGPGTYYDYPGININAQGDIGMTYIESGKAAGMFESMYITGRTPSDAGGTMETPVLVQAGTADYNFSGFSSPRQGDMSRVAVDLNGSFWAISQWTDKNQPSPNWNTAIANFSLGVPLSIVLTSATEGVPLSNVPVAEFIDQSGAPLSSYSATINWGDGTSTNGTVVAGNSPGTFVILGSHTYIDAGDYTLTVSESNGTTTLGPVSGTIAVADAPLQGFAQALNAVTAGYVTNGLVAVFTDTDSTLRPTSHYSATITWNEGNGLAFTSAGAIVQLFGNTFEVFGSSPYTFPSGGLFTVQVVIQDVNGASVTVNSVLSIANNQAIPPLVPQLQSDTGPVTAQFVTLQDTLTNLLSAERLFLFAVAFGTTAEKQGTFNNLVNALNAYEAAIFYFDMKLPGA